MALTKTILFLVLTAYVLIQVNESLAELDEKSLLWDMMKSDSLNGKAVRDIRELQNSSLQFVDRAVAEIYAIPGSATYSGTVVPVKET
ncbi:hypothetical protein P5673_017721 [Acropora cervicornis]|uniref:Uncharacterized protein n=1 Tax=Acropora cervicornis TaxID=6130 RepID=A0AAD9V390_ACRCE|nr:hypothetical protein P5673_017721 [Acropora cervicornis]